MDIKDFATLSPEQRHACVLLLGRMMGKLDAYLEPSDLDPGDRTTLEYAQRKAGVYLSKVLGELDESYSG